ALWEIVAHDGAGASAASPADPAEHPEARDLLVLVHDAARPIVSARVIDEVAGRLRESREAGGRPRAVIPVVPVGETLKEVAWPLGESPRVGLGGPAPGRSRLVGHVERTVPREGLWLAQTPQGFTLGPLLAAHRQAMAAGLDATDDAMLYEWKQWCVESVPGSPGNIKVTYPEELALLARALADRV
ncbi:MAG: 2-C-methyl-D-erythritol 4-phosphate cytidylyltransferase, partial [Candidatus Eisenbacteria bacterium]|nr:2-C-methyl-D-erythritol 4-phosphate cytidylyltransferase [Candidatus Eisenbacteria bacterium]